jgi:hypothetical protein
MEVIRASLDRFEGEYAVVYSDKDGRKFDVPKEMLANATAGLRLTLYVENNSVIKAETDKATDESRERIRRKYDKLRGREHPRRR